VNSGQFHVLWTQNGDRFLADQRRVAGQRSRKHRMMIITGRAAMELAINPINPLSAASELQR
jgi:hypothetical protein